MVKSYVTNQRAVLVKNPTYWGKDAQGRQLPYLDEVDYMLVTDTSAANLQLQSGAVDVQPQTVFQGGRPCSSDPSLRVDVYPSTGIRELAFNVTKTPWQDSDPPGGGLLARPPGDQQGAVRRPQQPRLRHVLGAHGVPGQPHAAGPRPGLRQGQALLSAAGHPSGVDVTLTVANYLENPAYAQLIQAQCKPAGINVKINEISYNAIYAGSNSTTPWLNAPMVIVEWGSRPTPGVYAQAMLLPTSAWSSSHWNDCSS